MRKSNWFGTAIFLFAVIFLAAGLIFIRWPDFENKQAVHRVLTSQSVLDLSLDIKYDTPPVYRETWHFRNDNGVSTYTYRIQGYNGKVVTITQPPDKTYQVTFLFQEVVQDGIWRLMNKPLAGDTNAHYTLHIFQVADKEHGQRTVTFTDPHFWATTAGRQYHIVLSKSNPVPDLTKLNSTTLADPHYEQIVKAIRNFGTPAFHKRIAQARALVSSPH